MLFLLACTGSPDDTSAPSTDTEAPLNSGDLIDSGDTDSGDPETTPGLPDIKHGACGRFSNLDGVHRKVFDKPYTERTPGDRTLYLENGDTEGGDVIGFRCESDGLHLDHYIEYGDGTSLFTWEEPALIWPIDAAAGDSWSLTLSGEVDLGHGDIQQREVDLDFMLTAETIETPLGPIDTLLLSGSGASAFQTIPGSPGYMIAVHDGWGVIAYSGRILQKLE